MKLRTRLTVAVLATASVLFACSSSSAKKNESPPPTAEEPQTEQPSVPEVATENPAADKTSPSSAVPGEDLKKKTTARYADTVQELVGLPAAADAQDAQKALDEHFLAIECGVHVYGEAWPGLQREMLRSLLGTPEKQEAYVRAQSRMKTRVLELRSFEALNSLCK